MFGTFLGVNLWAEVWLSRLYRNIATRLHQCLRLSVCVWPETGLYKHTWGWMLRCELLRNNQKITPYFSDSLLCSHQCRTLSSLLCHCCSLSLSQQFSQGGGANIEWYVYKQQPKNLHSMALRWIPVEQLRCFKGLVKITFHLWSWRGGDSQLLACGTLLQMLSFPDTPDESHPAHVMLSGGFLPVTQITSYFREQ